MPVPASPSGGARGMPGRNVPVGSRSRAPASVRRPASCPAARTLGNTSRKRQEYPFPAMRASNFSTMPASKSRVALSMGNIPAASPAPITFSPVSRQWI